MPPKTIRTVPEISVAALQAKLDRQLVMWYCLRAVNQWGSGRLQMEYAVKSLVTDFGYRRGTAYRILRSGDGLFWEKRGLRTINRLQIKIYGLKNVAKYFDIHHAKCFAEIPTDEFLGCRGNHVARQRALLYSTFHPPLGAKSLPMARASIQQATGISRRSQQRYDQITTVRVSNYAYRQDTSGKITPIMEFVDGKSRQWKIHKRLGNTYYCRARRVSTGMLSKVNTALGRSFKRGEARFPKRFFTTARSYLKCPGKNEDSYLILSPANIGNTSRMEWCQVNP